VYASQKEYAKAEQSFRKALQLDSTSLTAYTLLGQLFIMQNSVDRAIQEFENALKVNPKSVQTWTLLGSIYETQKNIPKAMENYRQALKIDSKAAVAANNLAWQLAETRGNLDEALNLARTAREVMPTSINVADTLGWVYYRRGAYQTAADLLKECVEKDAKNPTYHYHLGMIYFKMGNKEGAKTELEEALRLSQNFPGAADAKATLDSLR